MTADKRRRFTRSSSAPVFANGVSFTSYSSGSMGGKAFFVVSRLTGVSAQSPADMNATLIIAVIIRKSVSVSGAVVPGDVGVLLIHDIFFFFFNHLHSALRDKCPGTDQMGLRNGYLAYTLNYTTGHRD